MPLDLVALDRDPRAPYRILSDSPADAGVLARRAPGTRKNLRFAGGVALDLRAHVTGTLSVIDHVGVVVPVADWLLPVRDARRGGTAAV